MRRQAKMVKNVGESTRVQNRLRELASAKESNDQDRESLAQQLTEAETALREVRDQLRIIEGLQADVREQELLEATIADGNRALDSARAEIRDFFGANWFSLAAGPLQAALDRVRDQNSAFQRNQQDIERTRLRITLLEDRARGGKCPTCGQQLPPPSPSTSEELDEARAGLRRLLDEAGGELDLASERRLTQLVDTKTIPQMLERYRRIAEIQMLQYERKQSLEAIGDRLQGHSAADIRVLGQRNRDLEAAIEEIRTAERSAEQRAGAIRVEQQTLNRKLRKLPGPDADVVLESSFFNFVDDLLKQTIDAYRERVRAEVEADAQSMFTKLIRDPGGYGGLRITEDYKIELLDTVGEPRDTSEGGRQLLALSLIGALKHAAVRGGPVVLDSPLGRLDLQHRANVLQSWIPSLGAQAVLLVQSGELTQETADELLGSLIGRTYQIRRPTSDPEYALIEPMGRQ